MKRQGRCFPIEYYPGEFLTEVEANRNRKMVYVYIIFVGTIIAGSISPCGAVGLPAPSSIHRVQPNNLDRIGVQKNHNLRYAQISDNYLY